VDTTLPGSYISVATFTNEATGLDLTTLNPGVLARKIQAASRWCDRICKQTLYATLDTVTLLENAEPDGFAISTSDGSLMLYPRQFPITSIVSINVSTFYGTTEMPVDLTTVGLFPRFAQVDGAFLIKNSAIRIILQNTNGWCVSTTSAVAAAGASTISVNLLPQIGAGLVGAEPILYGWLPGQVLEIQDGDATETVTILSTATNVITLTGTTQYRHAKDTMVMDPAFANAQQACMLKASDEIKSRGIGPVMLRDEAMEAADAKHGERHDDQAEAIDLLTDYMVQF
jgi:hypothetical protein